MRIKTAKVKNLIYLKGDTINSFAVKHDFSQQALSAWINKDYYPTPKNVKKLAKALGCPVEDIIEDEEQDKTEIYGAVLTLIEYLRNTPVEEYTPEMTALLRDAFLDTLLYHCNISLTVLKMFSAKDTKD